MFQRGLSATFVVTLAVALLGGILLVAAQAAALVAGQGAWLTFLDGTAKTPVVIAASLCAVAGFLLSYRDGDAAPADDEALTR